MGYLDQDGLAYLWQKIKTALAGKQDAITPGDGLSKDGDNLNVDNPVRGIMTQTEFDGLTDEQKASGTYFVNEPSANWWSPKMTSNNAPIPYVATASSDKPVYGSTGPYAVFDDDKNTYWTNDQNDDPPWIAIDFGEEKEIFGLQMWGRLTVAGQLPHTFTVQGSHNGADWVDVYAAYNLPLDYAGLKRDFVFPESVTYRYYRITNMRSYYRFSADSTVDTYIGIANIRFADDINSTNSTSIYSNGVAVQIHAGATIDQVNAAIDEKLEGVTAQEVYSTEEQRIGTWIDGKPLYRRVYELTTPGQTGSGFTIGTIEANMNVVNIDGYMITSVGVHQQINSFYGENTVGTVTRDTNIRMIVSHGDYVSRPCWVVLEYTKTTDTAATARSAQSAATIKQSNSALDLTNIPSAPVTAAAAGVEIARMEEV